jgi:hypothetical protein
MEFAHQSHWSSMPINKGNLGWWSNGVLGKNERYEEWKEGKECEKKKWFLIFVLVLTIIPLFHHSIIPFFPAFHSSNL